MGRGIVLVLLAVAACRGQGAEPPGPLDVIELRNAEGRAVLTVKRSREGMEWSDTATSSAGELKFNQRALVTVGSREVYEARPAAKAQDAEFDIIEPSNRILEVRRVDGILRLGERGGTPLARVRRDDATLAVVHDAGGIPFLQARESGGRILLSSRDGRTIGFITGTVDLDRAALANLPGLPAAEQAILLGWH